MNLYAKDWFIDAEIVLNCLNLGLKMYEIPIKFQDINTRKSFVRINAVLEFTRNLFAYRFGWPPFENKRKL